MPSAVNIPAEESDDARKLRSWPRMPNTYTPENEELLVKVPVAEPWPTATPLVEPNPVPVVLSHSISFMWVESTMYPVNSTGTVAKLGANVNLTAPNGSGADTVP